MNKLILAAVCLVTCLAPLASATTGKRLNERNSDAEVIVEWKKKSYRPNELPLDARSTVASAAEHWGSWVTEHDYEMHLSTDTRVLVICRRKNSAISRQLKLIDKTATYFDKLFPARELKPNAEPGAGDKSPEAPEDDGELPEDPESGPAGWTDGKPEEVQTWSYEWGAATFELDTETCLLFIANNMEDYGSILDRLGETNDYLRAWLPTGKRLTGFVLERPLAAAYVENVSGQEEWDPKNELVNRVTQMLFLRRFSQLPYWLVQGLAWHVENELLGGLYCFPYRDEFVFATEHGGWPTELRNRYRKLKPRTVDMSEIATWQRGKFLPDPGKTSFGMVSFLVKHKSDALPAFAERLRLFWEEDNRVDKGNGSWARKTDYAISADQQERLVREFFGDDVLDEAARSFAEGKSYRPKR